MPLAEIAASVKMMGEVVTNTREIVKAVNDGREYLKRYYPDAQEDIWRKVSLVTIQAISDADIPKAHGETGHSSTI